jgi:hypothetical protein
MSTTAPDSNETSQTKGILNAWMDDSIMARLPRGRAAGEPPPPQEPPVILAQANEKPPIRRPLSGCLPAFWTIASLISMVVNVVLLALVLILFDMVGVLQQTANDQVSSLMGGLYQNFEKMERATITRTIPVDANIPLNITVPVETTTRITLATDTVIPNAHVFISEGGITINAPARVTLPANTALNVNIERFDLLVQNTIPVHLDVPVNIPLRETELNEPFIGLQDVIEPWYCLVEPNANVMGEQICSPFMNPEGSGSDTP